jgi:hypothetical protein
MWASWYSTLATKTKTLQGWGTRLGKQTIAQTPAIQAADTMENVAVCGDFHYV